MIAAAPRILVCDRQIPNPFPLGSPSSGLVKSNSRKPGDGSRSHREGSPLGPFAGGFTFVAGPLQLKISRLVFHGMVAPSKPPWEKSVFLEGPPLWIFRETNTKADGPRLGLASFTAGPDAAETHRVEDRGERGGWRGLWRRTDLAEHESGGR